MRFHKRSSMDRNLNLSRIKFEGEHSNSYVQLRKAQLQYNVLLLYYCKEIWIYVFPKRKLCGLSPNFHIHVSVSEIYIPTVRSTFVFSCNRIGRPIREIYKWLTETLFSNWNCRRAVPFLGIFVSNIRYCVFAVYCIPRVLNSWSLLSLSLTVDSNSSTELFSINGNPTSWSSYTVFCGLLNYDKYKETPQFGKVHMTFIE
jgi:hypothetical protein